MWKNSEIFLENYKVNILAPEKLENENLPQIILETEMYP